MINEQERFKDIEELYAIVVAYKANGVATISIEQKMMLKKVYQSIYGNHIVMDLSCPSCQITYITFLHSWYHREYPIWLAAQAVIEPVPFESVPVEPVPGKSKKRQSR